MKVKKSLGIARRSPARRGRRLGQNFLRDQKILKKIVDFADIGHTDTVVEVGPGEGTLTKFLLEKALGVVAVEKDEGLAKLLSDKFRRQIADNKLKIIEGDILLAESAGANIHNPALRGEDKRAEALSASSLDYKLVGNIPYYITGQIFKKFLQSKNPPKSITFVVQREVADRIMARDNKESVLSISIKAYGVPEFGGVIKAGSFSPKPKVDSAIIAVRNINKDKFKEILEEKFFKLVKLGFSHRRKYLIRNLEGYQKNKEKLLVLETFRKKKISPKIRAENLKIDDWFNLAKEL